MSWLILRIFTGHTLKVAKSVADIGIEVYSPHYFVTRRQVFDRRQAIRIERPLFPGYLFPAEPFDVAMINLSPVKTRIMSRDGHYITVSPKEMDAIREAEKQASRTWQPCIDDIIKGLSDCIDSVQPRKFMKLGDLQKAVAA